MNRFEFSKNVSEGRLLPAMLFLGEERLFHEELLGAVLERLVDPVDREFNFQRISAAETTAETLVSALNTPSFFGGSRLIHLAELETAAAGIEETLLKAVPAMADGVYLVVSAIKLDGRKKVHQELQKRLVVVDCGRLTPNDLPAWVRQRSERMGVKLTPIQIKILTERLGLDLLRYRTELTKIQVFLGNRNEITGTELDQLVPGEPEPDIFGLIDAVAERDPRRGLPHLADLLDSGENELKILATLSRQFRNITAALTAREQGIPGRNLAAMLGINPYVADKSLIQSGHFTRWELNAVTERLTRADYRIKTGQREPRLELELAVVDICSLKGP